MAGPERDHQLLAVDAQPVRHLEDLLDLTDGHHLEHGPPRSLRRQDFPWRGRRQAPLPLFTRRSRVWTSMPETIVPAPAGELSVQDKVLDIVRALAGEVGGPRAARAASPDASLERDLGLGSLERVELLLRLETAFGRTL